jgi:hypothetical protein
LIGARSGTNSKLVQLTPNGRVSYSGSDELLTGTALVAGPDNDLWSVTRGRSACPADVH